MATTKAADRFGFTLTLKVDDDHSYDVKSPSVEVGAYFAELYSCMMQAEAYFEKGEEPPAALEARLEALTKNTPKAIEEDSNRALLGDAYDQMCADQMPYEVLKLAAATVGVWIQTDIETAVEYWDNGGRRRRPTRTPSDRKTKKSSSRGT